MPKDKEYKELHAKFRQLKWGMDHIAREAMLFPRAFRMWAESIQVNLVLADQCAKCAKCNNFDQDCKDICGCDPTPQKLFDWAKKTAKKLLDAREDWDVPE